MIRANVGPLLLPAVAVFFFSTLAATAQTKGITFSTVEQIAEDVKAAPCKGKERLEAVKKLFLKMGAADSDIAVESKGGVNNVVVVKKGKTDEIVIIGAHYDKVANGCGAIDNWTGVTIIAHVYRTMKDAVTNKTYKFVAFDSEEAGLVGSAMMAKSIPKEKRAEICSMVNLDSFGIGYPRSFADGSDPKMIAAAKDLAASLKMPFENMVIPGAGADSISFRDKGIPAVTFVAVDANWPNYLHNINDKVENINMSSVSVGYQFAFRYIAKIDAAECDVFRKKPASDQKKP